MIYNGKTYKRVEVFPLSPWSKSCAGCAFEVDEKGCLGSFKSGDEGTVCETKGKNFIFKECQKDD